MTREEAIDYLTILGGIEGITAKEAMALEIAIEALEQEPCEDSISRANALRVAKNEYLRGWHNALCKALSEKYSIHCEEGNFSVIQEETITGLGLSMNCAVGKDVESYMSTIPSVTLQEPRWIPVSERLPKEGKEVLVSGYDTYNKKVIISRYQGEQYGFICGLVSAWMPLPKPYGEVEE